MVFMRLFCVYRVVCLEEDATFILYYIILVLIGFEVRGRILDGLGDDLVVICSGITLHSRVDRYSRVVAIVPEEG